MPVIDIILGPVAAGKSRLSQQIAAERQDAINVDIDQILLTILDKKNRRANTAEESIELRKKYIGQAKQRGNTDLMSAVFSRKNIVIATCRPSLVNRWLRCFKAIGYDVNLHIINSNNQKRFDHSSFDERGYAMKEENVRNSHLNLDALQLNYKPNSIYFYWNDYNEKLEPAAVKNFRFSHVTVMRPTSFYKLLESSEKSIETQSKHMGLQL